MKHNLDVYHTVFLTRPGIMCILALKRHHTKSNLYRHNAYTERVLSKKPAPHPKNLRTSKLCETCVRSHHFCFCTIIIIMMPRCVWGSNTLYQGEVTPIFFHIHAGFDSKELSVLSGWTSISRLHGIDVEKELPRDSESYSDWLSTLRLRWWCS